MTHLRIFALTVIGVCVSAATASADIIITLTQSGTGVIASLSGSGVVDVFGNGPGEALNFDNFAGQPFSLGLATNTFQLQGSLTITGIDADGAPGSGAYVSTYSQLVIANQGVGGSDIDLPDGANTFTFGQGDTYSASGSATVLGLSFSDLNPGTYLSSSTGSNNDAADFRSALGAPNGVVTLNIVAVPEPQTVALMFGVTALALARVRRQRKADRQSESHA